MSKAGGEFLEQFRKLLASDQREILNLLHRELSGVPAKSAPEHRKSIAEVAGKHRPRPNAEAASHDAGFAEAIAASKTGSLSE
jgi:hypothetical protein